MVNMTIYYSVTDGKAKIIKCCGSSPDVCLPAVVGGYPVTEIGDYAFAPPQSDAWRRGENVREQEFTEHISGGDFISLREEQQLCGNFVTSVSLPDSVTAIGSYAFFNCRRLKRLKLTQSVSRFGGNAFMNCEKLSHIDMHTGANGKSCLSELVSELQHELHVTIHYGENGGTARLVFPHYDEVSAENVEARIFEMFIQGSGYRYRQCFQDGAVNYPKYDSLFGKMNLEDKQPMVIELALERLQYPYQLTETGREGYLAYLKKHGGTAASLLIRADDQPRLEFLASQGALEEAALAEAIETAGSAGKTECLSFLLDYKHTHFKRQEKTFDL